MANRVPRRRLGLLAVGLVAVILTATYGTILLAFSSEGELRNIPLEVNPVDEDVLLVYAQVTSVDAERGRMTVRFEFSPPQTLLDKRGALASDVSMVVTSWGGPREFEFARGKYLSPLETEVELFNGHVSDYPFDLYESVLLVDVAATDPEGDTHALPLAMDLSVTAHGYTIFAAATEDTDATRVGLQFSVERSFSTVFFAFFVMGAMWLLTISTALIALAVVFRGRAPSLEMMAYMGALLFAFPALRDAAPGTPPVGTLSDVLSFFWAEGLVTISLIVVVGAWLVRGEEPAQPLPAGSASVAVAAALPQEPER